MQPKDALDIIAYVVGIGTTVVVVRSNVKKQIIEEQQALIEALQGEIEVLQRKLKNKESADGNTGLVRQGHHAGKHGQGRGNRSAASKTTKDRTS